MFGNAVSDQNFSFLEGVSGAHHSISHHMNDADKLRQYQLINRWHIEQYAYLLRKLQAMKEGERTVLDNSMILFGAGMRDGNKHDPHNLPHRARRTRRRADRAGQHLTYDKDTPLANLVACRCSTHSARRWSDLPTAPACCQACSRSLPK